MLTNILANSISNTFLFPPTCFTFFSYLSKFFFFWYHIQEKYLNHQRERYQTQQNFPSRNNLSNQKVGAFIHLSKHVPHLNLLELGHEKRAITHHFSLIVKYLLNNLYYFFYFIFFSWFFSSTHIFQFSDPPTYPLLIVKYLLINLYHFFYGKC